jgi:hypothetical protein
VIKGMKKNKKDFFIDRIKVFIANMFSIQKLIIFEIDLENPKKIIPSLINLSFRVGTKKDIDSMDYTIYDYNEKGKEYSKNQFDKGDRCILAINNDRIIGYVWIMKNYMELSVDKHIPISATRSYIYKGFVLKEIRGKRVLNTIDNYIIELLYREGKKFIVTTVADHNKSSIKARERIGFKIIGKIIQIRFFIIKYDYISKKDLIYLQSP